MKPNVLLLEPLSRDAHAHLATHTQLRVAPAPDAGEGLATQHDIRAIVTRGKGRVDRALLDACPNLQVISRAGVGLDNVAVEYATERGIRVINTPGANAATVAEHTFGLLLSLQRRLHPAIEAVKAGHWDHRLNYSGDEIRGKTLGILGRGNIGSRVGKLAEAFGMRVLFLARAPVRAALPSPQVQAPDPKSDERNLTDLLGESDVISLHLPLTDDTRHLLNKDTLAACRPGSLIVNTARGEIVDHAALLAALKDGTIGAYAADVMSKEQLAASGELLSRPDVLVTPHLASLTQRTFSEMCDLSVQNLLRLLAGDPVPERYLANF